MQFENPNNIAGKYMALINKKYKWFLCSFSLLLVVFSWSCKPKTISNFSMGNSHFIALHDLEYNLSGLSDLRGEDKLICSYFLQDLESLAHGRESYLLNEMDMMQKTNPLHAQSSLKYLFYQNLYQDSFAEARRYLGFINRLEVDSSHVEFLTCVLDFAENYGDHDCMHDQAGNNRISEIRKCAKKFR